MEVGAKVFALVWMAVFKHYPVVFEQIEPLWSSGVEAGTRLAGCWMR